MLLGQVVGTVVSTKKTESLIGLKLLLVQNLDITGKLAKGYHVAADSVQAGLGDVVIYSTGSAARQTDITTERPVDAVVMGIVDTWDVNGKTAFNKSEPLEVADV